MRLKGKLHILVVDYDEIAAKATGAMLEHLGYTVQTVPDSFMALRAFSEDPEKFDLAIIEPLMPELTGIDLAVRFKRISRGFPVMLYSGFIDPPLMETITTAGLAGAVSKPMGLQELREAVNETVNRPLVDIY